MLERGRNLYTVKFLSDENSIVKNKSREELKASIIADKQNAEVIYFPYNSILPKNWGKKKALLR